jgi:hypothetical protein
LRGFFRKNLTRIKAKPRVKPYNVLSGPDRDRISFVDHDLSSRFVAGGLQFGVYSLRAGFGPGSESMGDMEQQREPVRGLTFEDVWAMFQETGQKMRETDRFIRDLTVKTDRQIKDLTEKTDRQIKEMAEKAEQQFKRTDRQIGELGNRFGELAEHLVTPNIAEKFRALNYTFTKAGPDVEFFDREGKALTEVDVWLENGEFVMAVEVKSHLRKRDLDDHIRRMDILRRYLDERGDTRKLIGAVAGAIVRPELKSRALGEGFYVIEQSGDTVKIEAPEGFTPKVW